MDEERKVQSGYDIYAFVQNELWLGEISSFGRPKAFLRPGQSEQTFQCIKEVHNLVIIEKREMMATGLMTPALCA